MVLYITYKLFLVVQSVIFCKIKLDIGTRLCLLLLKMCVIHVVLLTWRIRYVTRCLATMSAKLTEIAAVNYEAVAHFVVFFHEIILLSSNSQFLVTYLLACPQHHMPKVLSTYLVLDCLCISITYPLTT